MLLLALYVAVLCVAALATHLERFLAAAGSFAAVRADQSNLRHVWLCTVHPVVLWCDGKVATIWEILGAKSQNLWYKNIWMFFRSTRTGKHANLENHANWKSTRTGLAL